MHSYTIFPFKHNRYWYSVQNNAWIFKVLPVLKALMTPNDKKYPFDSDQKDHPLDLAKKCMVDQLGRNRLSHGLPHQVPLAFTIGEQVKQEEDSCPILEDIKYFQNKERLEN